VIQINQLFLLNMISENIRYNRKSAINAKRNLQKMFEDELKLSSTDHWIGNEEEDSLELCEHLSIGFEPLSNLRGVFVTTELKKGLILGEYCGTLIQQKGKIKAILDNGPPFYIVKVNKKTWIDGEFTGNILSLINHSCIDENCIMYKVSPNRVAIKLLRDMKPFEFLHYNYNLEFKKDIPLTLKCLCHENCTNYIG